MSNRRENILTITYNGRAASFSGEEQKLHRIKAEIEGMTASLKEEELLEQERKYALITA